MEAQRQKLHPLRTGDTPRECIIKSTVLRTETWRAQPLMVEAEEELTEVRIKEGGGNDSVKEAKERGVLKKGVTMLSIFWQRFNQIRTERQITVPL